MEGYVTESKYCHERITYVRPIRLNYSDKYHPNYYKYICPICDSLGNAHQISKGDKNCPLCNVNLIWNGESEE